MVIWPASSLRISAKAMEELYQGIAEDGSTTRFLERMQTRKELYETLGYHDYEALDQSIVKTVVPEPVQPAE